MEEEREAWVVVAYNRRYLLVSEEEIWREHSEPEEGEPNR
jgi:hypothetical protein